ncbi:MAG: hypothetical protein N2111_06390 [Candidatus Sumerlaeaceae bacterium]|nr:hypothetical protein [Candidatus Sumerlaeaceae bacterium]
MTDRSQPAGNGLSLILHSTLTAAIVVFLGLHLLAVFMRPPNPDEWQQLRNSYDLYMGERLYEDFWDNHGPFLTYLQAPWFGVLPRDHYIICLMRLPLWFVTVAVALFTALAARVAFPEHPLLPRLSALFVLAAPTYLAKAYEVRGDNILNALYALALFLVLRGFRTGRQWHFLLGGLACGLIFGFSIKVLFVGFAFFLIFLMRWWMERRIQWGPMLLFGAGNAMIFGATLAWLHGQGLLDGFMQAYFGANLDREHDFNPEPLLDLIVDYPVATLLAGAALGAGAIRLKKGIAEPSEQLLWPAAFFLPFSYFFLLPTHHLQSLLSSHPLVAMFVALLIEREVASLWDQWALVRRLKMRPQVLAAIALSVACALHAIGVLLWLRSGEPNLRSSIDSANALMRLGKPDEMILDGRGLPLYRPKPLFARSLVNHVRSMYGGGKMNLDIPGRLQAKGVRFVVMDRRVSSLEFLLPWFERHYLPMALLPEVNDLVMVAGTIARADTTSATVAIAIPAEYWFESLPQAGGVIAVNGSESGPWRLEAGNHTVQVRDGVTTIIASAVPPTLLWNLAEIERFDLSGTADIIRRASIWDGTVRYHGDPPDGGK